MLDSVQGGIILFDPAGSLRFLNAKFAQYFSLDLLRRSGKLKDFSDRTGKSGSEEVSRSVRLFRSSESLQLGGQQWRPRYDELEITRPAHRVLERFSRPVLDTRGKAVGWLELYNDVTGERSDSTEIAANGENGGPGATCIWDCA